MMSLWDALRMNMMISYQELVRTFPKADSDYKSRKITQSLACMQPIDTHTKNHPMNKGIYNSD